MTLQADYGPAAGVPRASVIIPTYNRADMLRATLEALAAQTLPIGEYEVIVSDDGSSDDTRAVVESFSGRLRIKYQFQDDLGFRAAAARNAGARLASAPVLVFLDSGTLAGSDFVAAHVRAHEGAAGAGRAVIGYVHGYPPTKLEDPDFHVVQGMSDAVTRLSPEQVVALYREEPSFRDSRHAELEKVGFDLSARTVPEELFWTSNCSVGTAAFWAVAGFDEDFRSWGMEDMDLGYRLARNGAGFRLSLDAWAVEMPHERDDAANLESSLKNVAMFLDKRQFAEPLLEIVWLMLRAVDGRRSTLEETNRMILDWALRCRDLEVGPLIEEEFARIPAGKRVAVFGAGPTVPASVPPSVLVDFDPQAVELLRAAGGHDVRYNVGIRTALPDGAVDVVVITPRLSGIWEQFGEAILGEAARIGAQTRCLFDAEVSSGVI
jgi:glycosyltransferase involved in cell wall biosynthesis